MHGEHISHHSLSHALTDYAHVVHLPVMITHIGGSSDRNSTLIFMVCLCRLSFSSVDIGFQFLNIHCRESIHSKLRLHRGDYRSAPLFIRKHELKRKPYNQEK